MSEGSADEIPVFYQNIAVSLEKVASFVSPSIQKIWIDSTQLFGPPDFYNLLKDGFSEGDQHGSLHPLDFGQLGVVEIVSCEPEVSGYGFL